MTLTFAFSRAEASTFVSWGRSLVEGRGLYVAFAAGDFTVNVVGQIPQEADTVLHQLQEKKKKRGRDDQRWRQEEEMCFWFHRIKSVNRYLVIHIFAVDL